MLKQNSVIKQIDSEIVKIDDQFQIIENLMMRIFNTLDENDKLIRIIGNEIEKNGGEKSHTTDRLRGCDASCIHQ